MREDVRARRQHVDPVPGRVEKVGRVRRLEPTQRNIQLDKVRLRPRARLDDAARFGLQFARVPRHALQEGDHAPEEDDGADVGAEGADGDGRLFEEGRGRDREGRDQARHAVDREFGDHPRRQARQVSRNVLCKDGVRQPTKKSGTGNPATTRNSLSSSEVHKSVMALANRSIVNDIQNVTLRSQCSSRSFAGPSNSRLWTRRIRVPQSSASGPVRFALKSHAWRWFNPSGVASRVQCPAKVQTSSRLASWYAE